MKHTKYSLKEEDHRDFEKVFELLQIPDNILSNIILQEPAIHELKPKNEQIPTNINRRSSKKDQVPSVSNFARFKHWMNSKLDLLEFLIKEKR